MIITKYYNNLRGSGGGAPSGVRGGAPLLNSQSSNKLECFSERYHFAVDCRSIYGALNLISLTFFSMKIK